MSATATTKILTKPDPDVKIGPVHDYDEHQKSLIDDLREYAYSLMLPESDSYHKWEKRWLNRPDTIPRYMRAAKWNLNDGKKRIKGTLEWRRNFKPELIPPDEIKIEDESGKILINGFDKDGRPIIYMRPGRQNTETSPRQLRHLVWCLERAKDLMPPGQESLVIIVDYKTTTLRTNPSISVASKVLTILQHHYVETLGRAIVTNLPFLLNFFYKGISPFLDPVTRDKMRFNPDLLELVPASQLEAEFGGEYEFEFEHESYWKQIIETCGIAPDGTRVHEDPDAGSAEESQINGVKDSTESSTEVPIKSSTAQPEEQLEKEETHTKEVSVLSSNSAITEAAEKVAGLSISPQPELQAVGA